MRHWIVTAGFLGASSYWFLFLRLSGPSIFQQSGGALTTLGCWVTWPIFGFSVLATLAKTWADRYNEEAKSRGAYIFQRLLECANAVTRHKADRFCRFISDHAGKKDLAPFGHITQPKAQITRLLDNIQFALSQILDIPRDDIGVSILYNSADPANWKFVATSNTSDELSLEAIVTNPLSTARQLIDRKVTSKSVFFPDKRMGRHLDKYVSAPRDSHCDGVGSILCREIAFGTDAAYPRAILSITTYGKQLCRADDTDAAEKLQSIIVPMFEHRLRLELALMFIKEEMGSRCVACGAMTAA